MLSLNDKFVSDSNGYFNHCAVSKCYLSGCFLLLKYKGLNPEPIHVNGKTPVDFNKTRISPIMS